MVYFILRREHVDVGIENDALYRSSFSNSMERANRLVADILTRYRLWKDLQGEGITDIVSLANRLQVSQHALKIRLGTPRSTEMRQRRFCALRKSAPAGTHCYRD